MEPRWKYDLEKDQIWLQNLGIFISSPKNSAYDISESLKECIREYVSRYMSNEEPRFSKDICDRGLEKFTSAIFRINDQGSVEKRTVSKIDFKEYSERVVIYVMNFLDKEIAPFQFSKTRPFSKLFNEFKNSGVSGCYHRYRGTCSFIKDPKTGNTICTICGGVWTPQKLKYYEDHYKYVTLFREQYKEQECINKKAQLIYQEIQEEEEKRKEIERERRRLKREEEDRLHRQRQLEREEKESKLIERLIADREAEAERPYDDQNSDKKSNSDTFIDILTDAFANRWNHLIDQNNTKPIEDRLEDYEPIISEYVHDRIKNEQDADEIIQDAMIFSWKVISKRVPTKQYKCTKKLDKYVLEFLNSRIEKCLDLDSDQMITRINCNMAYSMNFEFVSTLDLNSIAADVLSTLQPREELIIRHYFYMNKTLNEIGKEFGIHQQTVLQIRNKALRKLRYPPRAKKFSDYRYDNDPTRYYEIEGRE